MVCLGNICRSPLAEGILKDKVEKSGLDVEVDSAGTGGWHVGEKPDSRSIEKAWEYGINISGQRARQFKASDLKEFDMVYAMDASNYSNIIAMAESDSEIDKVKMILNESSPGSNQAVPDPYYGGADGFETVYQLLDEACDAIINKLK